MSICVGFYFNCELVWYVLCSGGLVVDFEIFICVGDVVVCYIDDWIVFVDFYVYFVLFYMYFFGKLMYLSVFFFDGLEKVFFDVLCFCFEW